ncbi:hypothetical protein GCM10009541_44930 [Micromonospora gifhornensis]|uniref:Uncharacterized protein n=1 Tax=Micromonospora gifhornensis TaxID=84594 RepID=A0ABQ4IMZ0_9ACTN|nr:hypothetical protein Vgi01_59560 [Micromonospora gifhornensis]
MTASHGVIDLDMHGAELGDSDGGLSAGVRPGRKGAAYMVVALVVGLALGSVGGAEVWSSREERAEASTVTLVALPGPSNSWGSLNGVGTVRLDAQLVLFNAGQAPVIVQVDEARKPGVLVRGTGQSWLVRPGGTSWIDVEVTLECATAFTPEPLSVNFSVQTADQRIRRAGFPLALQGSPWQRACEPPPRVVPGPVTASR